jgi:hypothetical protein
MPYLNPGHIGAESIAEIKQDHLPVESVSRHHLAVKRNRVSGRTVFFKSKVAHTVYVTAVIVGGQRFSCHLGPGPRTLKGLVPLGHGVEGDRWQESAQ